MSQRRWRWIQLPRKKRKFRRGHAPYLTKIRLFWCDICNVPRFEDTECAVCSQKPRKVDLSPPGDPFPAFKGHLKCAIAAINKQYGSGIGEQILPSSKTVVMNKTSALDAMYEVIVDGYILGRLRFNIPLMDYTFLLSLEGARRVGSYSERGWVSIYDDVLEYLLGGANLMLPGIKDNDHSIAKGDEVWITDSKKHVVGVGIARMSGNEMDTKKKGYAVKVREVSNPKNVSVNKTSATWNDAIAANSHDLERIENEALSFIKRANKRYDLPTVVGFSGGKDSLATYLLVEKALEHSPPIFFVNTGLEFPETVHYIDDFAKTRNARIIGRNAGNRFWESFDTFGPPARDFRWCCKILKLGPAAQAITEELGGEILTFMGQRKLESFQRSIEQRTTTNPWVPGQISANPIQNWNALEVWLYILREGATFNPLYKAGFHRMGCYLCPASPLAEFEQIRETHPELYQKWADKIMQWASKSGFPDEWVKFGFWRWKKLPKGQIELVTKMGLKIRPDRIGEPQKLMLDMTKGVSPCTDSSLSLEGQFSAGIDLTRISDIMAIFGKTKLSEEMGALRCEAQEASITLFSSGSMIVRGVDEEAIENLAIQVERAVRRALFCQACGSCIPRCKSNAINLEKGKIAVDERKCIQCMECNTWPCPTYLT